MIFSCGNGALFPVTENDSDYLRFRVKEYTKKKKKLNPKKGKRIRFYLQQLGFSFPFTWISNPDSVQRDVAKVAARSISYWTLSASNTL